MPTMRTSLGALDVVIEAPSIGKSLRGSSRFMASESAGGIHFQQIDVMAKGSNDEPNQPPRKKPRQKSPSRIREKKDIMVVSVDFGMTGSGLAFSVADADPQGVVCEKKWPGSGETSSKVPTIIAYQRENNRNEDFDDEETESRFGFEVNALEMTHHAFFKMALDEQAPTSKFDDRIFEAATSKCLLQSSTGKIGRQAIEDSLRHLCKILEKNICEQSGINILTNYDLKIIISHPAACSEHAKTTLSDAVKAAGWNKVSKKVQIVLRSESEAACIATIVANQARCGRNIWDEAWKAQSPIFVLDIGGLTVDSAALVVQEVHPKLQLNQICPAQGGKCGTTSFYCRLHKLLESLFPAHFQTFSQAEIGYGSPLLTQFEAWMRKFTGQKPKICRLSLALGRDFRHDKYDENNHQITLNVADLLPVLDGTITHMKAILDDQFERAARGAPNPTGTVILCGGGSLFPYVHKQLELYCKHHKTGEKAVIRPDDPQSAVVRGALISGLERTIMGKRRTRAAYGVSYHQKYRVADGNEDWSPDDVFECPYGGWRVDGFIKWHVKKNDVIDMSQPKLGKKLDGYLMLPNKNLDDRSIKHEIKIYSYHGDDQPPSRREDPAVHELGSIDIWPARMSKASKDKLRKKKDAEDDTPQKITIYQLVNAGSGLIEFVAKVNTFTVGVYHLNFGDTEPF